MLSDDNNDQQEDSWVQRGTLNSPISEEQSGQTKASGVGPSSEVKLLNHDQTGKLAVSGQRDSQRELNSLLEPDISWEGTSAEESRDIHMEARGREGVDWEGKSKQDLPLHQPTCTSTRDKRPGLG